MNNSLNYEVEIEVGIGPQLVILGALLGSIFVGLLSSLISDHLFKPVSLNATSSGIAGEVASGKSYVSHEDNDLYQQEGGCLVSDKFSDNILIWCQEISKYSVEYGLAPDLIAAVMLQESGGDPSAYSHSGAVGLMQVMPRDGIAASFMCINGPCFSNRPSIQELQDPEFNIAYGSRMLANLIERYGDVRDALKSYGPKDVGYTYADKVIAIFDRFR